MGAYVLDTSALRGVGGRNLEAAVCGHDLLLSPVTFWEILCHLDETTRGRPGAQDAFDYGRALLLKCSIPALLEDPLAHLACRAGVPALVNPTRFEDRQGIPLILEQLQQSDSLDGFAARTISLPGSPPRPIRDIAIRTRAALDQSEDDYLRSIRQTAERIAGEFGQGVIRTISGRDFVLLARRAVAQGLFDEAVGAGVAIDGLLNRLSAAAYLCGGYLVARTLRALANNGFSPLGIAIDCNDTEDFMIAMHVSFGDPVTLVTDDTGTLEAVERALEELRLFGQTVSQTPVIQARVVNGATFVAETQAKVGLSLRRPISLSWWRCCRRKLGRIFGIGNRTGQN